MSELTKLYQFGFFRTTTKLSEPICTLLQNWTNLL